MMECIDDELSPWQREANKRAEAEYKEALNRIQAAKAGALAVAATSTEHAVTVTNVSRPPRMFLVITNLELHPCIQN